VDLTKEKKKDDERTNQQNLESLDGKDHEKYIVFNKKKKRKRKSSENEDDEDHPDIIYECNSKDLYG
jgi:hypothetical protein